MMPLFARVKAHIGVDLLFLLLFLVVGSGRAQFGNPGIKGPYPNGVPGSGYGCSNRCRKNADKNYVIEARLETYPVPGTLNNQDSPLYDRTTPPGAEQSMFTRTFVGDQERSSHPFCFGLTGSEGPLGPCLTVEPGDLVKIKMINRMNFGMRRFEQRPTNKRVYWSQANQSNVVRLGDLPNRPGGMQIPNEENTPGRDVSFDTMNLHLHGLVVVPHLFFPQGTGDPSAEWISISPPSVNATQRCFCYVFKIPPSQSQGTFWYHIHRHGSAAMQGWQGLVGFLVVTGPKSPEVELANYGITRDEPLAVWQWRIPKEGNNLGDIGQPNTFFEGQFISRGAKDTYMVNNAFQPTVQHCVNETVHYRFLDAQITTGTAFYIYDENDQVQPFWRFASDGISYNTTDLKFALVTMPGMREGLLLQFRKPGVYRMRQALFRGGPRQIGKSDDFTLMNFSVTDDDCTPGPAIDLDVLTFTPGVEEGDIKNSEVVAQTDITFGIYRAANIAPYPQFVINGRGFNLTRVDFDETALTAASWVLISNWESFHPFHIHVNPMQIITASVSDSIRDDSTTRLQFGGPDPNKPGTIADGQIDIVNATLATILTPENMWRDVVPVPPFGVVNVYQRFGARGEFSWTGKSVFHCHFLDHEDQGMITVMTIDRPNRRPNQQP